MDAYLGLFFSAFLAATLVPAYSEILFAASKYPKEQLPGEKHGSGLGLYISRQLAEKMCGQLDASSKGDGQGSQFVLRLNLVKP